MDSRDLIDSRDSIHAASRGQAAPATAMSPASKQAGNNTKGSHQIGRHESPRMVRPIPLSCCSTCEGAAAQLQRTAASGTQRCSFTGI